MQSLVAQAKARSLAAILLADLGTTGQRDHLGSRAHCARQVEDCTLDELETTTRSVGKNDVVVRCQSRWSFVVEYVTFAKAQASAAIPL